MEPNKTQTRGRTNEMSQTRSKTTEEVGRSEDPSESHPWLAKVYSWTRPIRMAFLYMQSRIRGESYVQFYRRMMDQRASEVRDATGSPSDKRHQLEFLIERGLEPSSRLLDLGCGAAAAGVHFIRYLESGRYVGADISQECLKNGRRRIQDAGLEWKNPAFVHLPGGNLEPIDGGPFDIIWAYSVLTHLPPEDLERLFSEVRSLMGPDTRFFATFGREPDGPKRRRVKDWYHPWEDIRSWAEEADLVPHLVPEWSHPWDLSVRIEMAKFTLTEEPGGAP